MQELVHIRSGDTLRKNYPDEYRKGTPIFKRRSAR